ncbi:cyclic nucleotide-binding domain-containing protein [Desulfopila inferna]|uniref:cyclic nucleotide-binding domain-containing protein n=1 Tax=Desulfopila inferna TaxID=468528 RepID=UPI0019645E62|nr:cyclic nucleotide-binding domain-containing protein [Desulfopila inferna]MBM9604625.1 cyclic nucleotide-binding domain-containing protein [Desulfopila inferna]
MVPSTANSSDSEDKGILIKKLFDEIEAAAKSRDFKSAEALREKLLETDATALTEIIKSAEIIEQEKAAGIDKDHLAIWDSLYSTLTQEEKNGLFYSMKRVVVPPKKIILSHGAYNTRLFFIDQGKVTIIFPRKGKNTVLAQLGKGNILGEYSFTSISLCSATAVSHTEVVLYCLENSATDSWHEELPGLYEKIIDFCIKHGSLEDISRWKSMEKRNKPRYPLSGPLKGSLLDKEGNKTETYFRGMLTDISVEGCAFEIKLSKKATARALLARHLLLQVTFEVNDSPVEFEMVGKVVKVTFFMHNDYCIHIMFDKSLKKATLGEILSKKRGKTGR